MIQEHKLTNYTQFDFGVVDIQTNYIGRNSLSSYQPDGDITAAASK